MPERKNTIEQHDERIHPHCPMLGGEIPFRYCRSLNEGKPCRRIETCWEGHLDIRTFLLRHYDLNELRATWEKPKPDKMVSILEILQNVTKSKCEDDR